MSGKVKLSPTKFTQAVVRSFMADSGLEPRYVPQGTDVTSATEGRVDFELDIQKEHTNRLQTIHGGTLASLVDLGGSLAVASSGRFATGVSTDLNVTYLSPGGRPGDLLKGTATLDKIGKTLAFTQVTFTNSKGQLAARGSHTKYVTGTMGEDGPFVAPAEFSDVD
ncbi:related to PaaI_thioesterase family protein [Fusarium fujikuroi]|nr:related to PaaI_thioesterase family protein [Fusarium fujikuroi]SCO48454.1 related to PaaI_thioesterase family protein [Fusarium fujikuroi]SCV35951.1 related to PaaI_thioesterase family protein [Fusarium fujikuroi]